MILLCNGAQTHLLLHLGLVLDALGGGGDEVETAADRARHGADQSFAHALEKTRGAVFLGAPHRLHNNARNPLSDPLEEALTTTLDSLLTDGRETEISSRNGSLL